MVTTLAMSREDHQRVVEAMQMNHRAEVAKLALQLVQYRTLLEEHGIEPPDNTGADLLKMWRRCMKLVSHATIFAHQLGSEKELLEVWS